MAITVTLTSTQPCLLALTVLVVNGTAASPAGATATSSIDVQAAITPSAAGSLIVGCSYCHNTSAPSYLSPYDSNTTLINDSIGILREAITYRSASAPASGVPVTIGPGDSGLQDDRLCALLEILAGSGGISLDSSAPPSLPATAPQNTGLAAGGNITSRTTDPFSPPPGALLVALGVGTYGPGAVLIASDSASTYTWSHPSSTNDSSGNCWINIGIPPAPPPSGTGQASLALAGTGAGHKLASGHGSAALALAGPASGHKIAHGPATATLHLAGSPSGHKNAHGSGTASLALAAAQSAYPPTPQVISGDRILLIALTRLTEQTQTARLPDVQQGQAVWCRDIDAAPLVAAGLAAWAPANTPRPPAEQPWTARSTPGLGRGASNVSH